MSLPMVPALDGEVLGPENGTEADVFQNPFTSERRSAVVPPGLTINETIDILVPNARLWRHIRVWVSCGEDSGEVPREMWGRVRPRPGSRVVIRCTPSGGGGKKSILGFILTLVILVAAFYLAPVLAPTLVSAGIGAEVATSVAFSIITTIGKALVSALIPPPKPNSGGGGGLGNSTQRLYAITGVQNRTAPFEAVPRVYGRMRLFPTIAGTPYNEILGGTDVYLRMLFDFGPGPLKISEIKIGDTPIQNFDDVEIEVGHVGGLSNEVLPFGTYYCGFSNDRDLTLYPTSVAQTNESIKIDKGTNITRNFPSNIVDGRVILNFPQGLVKINTAGAQEKWNVVVEAHYREVGTGTWIPMIPSSLSTAVDVTANPSGINVLVADNNTTPANVSVPPNWNENDYLSRYPQVAGNYVQPENTKRPGGGGRFSQYKGYDHWCRVGAFEPIGTFTPSWVNGSTAKFVITDKKQDPFYYSFKTPRLDPSKSYEFKINRVYGVHTETTTAADDVMLEEFWLSSIQGFRSVKPTQVTGHALMAIRIRSSEQLNGTLQTLSAKVEALLNVWNGSAWVPNQITRNPAWAAVDILRGNANARPVADSRLDLAGWKAFADWCDGNNSKGHPRAMFDGVFDSRTTVIQAIQQVLSVQRASFAMKESKFSVIYDDVKTTPVQLFTQKNSSNFSGKKIFFTPPHAMKVRFTSEDKNYTEDELTVYSDGYTVSNATLFEQIEAFGITRPEQAHWFGRYMLAQAILRPEVYSLDVDVENLSCRRGDLVRVQHDVPRWGVAAARVRAVSLSGPNVVSLTIDETVLAEAGKTYAIRGRKSDGAIILANLNMGGATIETNVLTLTTPTLVASMVAVGDLLVYGETSKETIQCLVRNIRRIDDLKASLELIDYGPDVFTSDTETIPDFDPSSTWQGQGSVTPPAVPVVIDIQSNEDVLVRTTTGYDEAIQLVLGGNSGAERSGARPDDYIEVRYGYVDGYWFTPTMKVFGNPGVISIHKNIRGGETYEIQLRRVTSLGLASGWSTLLTHTVVGKTTRPSIVTGFTATIRSDSVLLYWTKARELDVVGYELRIGASWAVGTKVEPTKSPTTGTTQYALPPLAAGSYTCWNRAIDELGLESIADASVSFTISPPGTPTVAFSYQGPLVVLSWADVQTSHRIAFYKIKRGADAPIEVKTTSASFSVNWTGSLVFEVWGVDLAGNEGPHGTVTVTNTGASAVTGFTHSIIGDAVNLSWDVGAPGSLPIASYEIRQGGTGWSDATFVANVSVTSFLTGVTWSGSRTFRIKAKDTAGNYGTEVTRAVNITAPATLTVSSMVSAGTCILSWGAPSSVLPVKEYEVRHGASYAAGTLVAVVSALSVTVPVDWTGTRSFWIVARTTTGLESTPYQRDVSVTAPAAPSVSVAIVGASVQLSWGVPASSLPVVRYEVRQGGTDFATATFVAYADTTIFTTPVVWSGTRTYRIAAIDTGGSSGTAGSADVTVTIPGVPVGVAADVVDNNVLLRWSAPATGSLPVALYRVKVGASWAGGTSIGDKSGTFTSHFQTAAGTYTYWIAAVDSAGNEGTPVSTSVTVNAPPDYVLKANYFSTFGGTLTNAVLDGGAVYMPVVTGQTFQQHFDNNGSPAWADPQDQIDAGYPIYIQPTTTTLATYVETYDFGVSIPSANITVTPTFETIAGSITWAGKVEVSPNGSSWTTIADPGLTGFSTSFRYVRMTIKATGAARTAVGRMTALNLRIDIKQITDSGVATCNSGDAGGTTVTFGKTFLDVDAIVVTPRSTTACYAIVDFTDAPNPTTFKILVFDTAGTRVTKDVGWEARGV